MIQSKDMNLWSKFRQSSLGQKVRLIVPQKAVNFGKHLPLAFLASIYYRFPRRNLKIIGVTGTDGKTTTVSLIYMILREAGLKTGMVSTVSAKIGDEEIETGFHVTAPDPWLLQKLLRKMKDSGMEYVILEATSHGLDQFRLWGINFEIGVLTNITHEHLDYHKTYENYLNAKAKLFKASKVAVLNKDDESYKYLDSEIQRSKDAKIVSYGIKNRADFTPQTFPFKTSLPGEYNQYNCLAAIAAVAQLKIPEEIIRQAVANFKGVIGRMEEINEGQDFKVFVDFAHTPNALKQVLSTLKARKNSQNKLIAVFGSAGFRDQTKRPLMGEIACQLADLVILTTDDPRTEGVEKIIDQIAAGCQKAGGVEGRTFYRIPDRQEAINFAVQKLARQGDIVALCGKGHEITLAIGKKELPWSEHEAARKAIKLLKKGD